ncbi:MAG: hypothetical protein PUF50_07540 [Erysipelotrichaceae bacterium]|nr:hypothetical protein [Erysipelotrichaceae bacterium]
MKITMAHLYYDLANLYGESGNVKVLMHYLQDQKVTVELVKRSLEDVLDFSQYDVVYIGAMTEMNQRLVINHLKQYESEIRDYLNRGGFLLATGNAAELFGTRLNHLDVAGLGIFSYVTKAFDKRWMQEVILANDTLDDVVGFQNQISYLEGVEHPWFTTVKQGMGANPTHAYEGVRENHFYGSYVIGPMLARNPHLTLQMVKEIMRIHGWEDQFHAITYDLDEKAYQSYKNIIKKG